MYKTCIFNSKKTKMKKFRWFTLLESLAVIGMIWIISAALYNMRNIWKDYTDYQKEAVNTIHKEIEHSLKEFQRAKVWTDKDWNVHEISSFQIKLTNSIWKQWILIKSREGSLAFY